MKKVLNNYLYLLLFLLVLLVLFSQILLHGLLPIPADTIVGLYNPFRDFYAHIYPRGIPFKNFLITDPVRQIYPWKDLSVQLLSKFQLPLWNPYEMAGTPLLANFQSSPFYPLNIVFFLKPFFVGWTLFIFLQPILTGLFLYFYLKNLKLSSSAAMFGGMVFALCGFSVAWMEWGTVVSTILWLPLVLLAKDKILESRSKNYELRINKSSITWIVLFVFSLVSSFFAGHLQMFFYLYIILIADFFFGWFKNKRNVRNLIIFIILNSVFIILTIPQWIPTLQFISLSARNVDQVFYTTPGWFLPWQNLVQFIVPDFFGNPTTLNYWGIFNYGEFVGYIGIIPLICAIFALLFQRNKHILFFGVVLVLSLLFALPNPVSSLPFILHMPFLSTAQPTRLIGIADFSLAILAAFGFDMIAAKRKQFVISSGIVLVVLAGIWILIFLLSKFLPSISIPDIQTAKHNMILPTIIVLFSFIVSLAFVFLPVKNKKASMIVLLIFFLVTGFDLVRFAQKFETFSPQQYLYPNTQVTQFLQKNLGDYRIAATDSQILPPNFPIEYHLQSIEGYDPLYLLQYGEFIAASERQKPDVSSPFGFNRILTPHNMNSPFINLSGVKYILSFANLPSPQFKQVFAEGTTKVFENKDVFPRVFSVTSVNAVNTKEEAIRALFDSAVDLHSSAVVEQFDSSLPTTYATGSASISRYSENSVTVHSDCPQQCFLVLTDTAYPTWKAFIDSTQTQIYTTDYNFRGIIVPSGKHVIEFSDHLF